MMAKSVLFEPMNIEGVALKNRFVRSATYEGLAARGRATDEQTAVYEELAKGGVGLIITGLANVHVSGFLSNLQSSVEDDACVEGYQKLTQAVHAQGGKIAMQLGHGGREAVILKKYASVYMPLAPSLVEDDPYCQNVHRAMKESEILEIARAFGEGARRAKEAGFDAVQLHGAHGYLFMQFLSPFTNRREDEWGGSLENRLRFHREVYNEIRKKVGGGYPVMIKLGVADGFAGGFSFEEGLLAAKHLAGMGFASLEISQGLRGKHYEETEWRTNIDRVESEGFFLDWAREVKKVTNVPVMASGGFRSLALMEKVIEKEEADFIALCRPLICEADLIKSFENGTKDKSACTSCNYCLDGITNGGAFYCIENKQ